MQKRPITYRENSPCPVFTSRACPSAAPCDLNPQNHAIAGIPDIVAGIPRDRQHRTPRAAHAEWRIGVNRVSRRQRFSTTESDGNKNSQSVPYYVVVQSKCERGTDWHRECGRGCGRREPDHGDVLDNVAAQH